MAMQTFDPGIPIEKASTPPSAWYTQPSFFHRERATVFRRSWQAVGRAESLARPGDYLTGEMAGEPYVVVRGEDEVLRAFYNVCRHHATCVAKGAGKTESLVCPYHGWTYGLDGRLLKAPRMGGVEEFRREEQGLIPMQVATWGLWVFVRQEAAGSAVDEVMRPLEGRLNTGPLRFEKSVRYEIECNWKVYVDNYLDGGYHVSHMHGGLASQLDLDAYRTEISGQVSLQTCNAGEPAGSNTDGGVDFQERLQGGAVYAFVYPNFMINRYGPMMDTNWVLPLGHQRTLTVFDYYFETGVNREFIERSLAASDQVQREDMAICQSVQRGLGSSAYDVGRYAPRVEGAEHHFHSLLAGPRNCRAPEREPTRTSGDIPAGAVAVDLRSRPAAIRPCLPCRLAP
jgi:choline monooxygenase